MQEIKLSKSYSIRVADNMEDIESIRSLWTEMIQKEDRPIITADIDVFMCQLNVKKLNPYVVILYSDALPVAMIVARIERFPIICKLGYWNIWNPVFKSIVVVDGGVLGNPGQDECKLLLRYLKDAVYRKVADVIFFHFLSFTSHMYACYRAQTGILTRAHHIPLQPHWMTLLPDNIDVFYKGNSKKRYLKRYVKSLEKACGGPVEMKTYESERDFDYVCTVAKDIVAMTYKRSLDTGFLDDYCRAYIRLNMKRGAFRAYVLYVNGRPCAFEFGNKYGKTFFPQQIGYDPDLRRHSPGTILFIKVLEELIRDLDIQVFDFGFGNAEYKNRFGTDVYDECVVYIFAARWYPVAANLLTSTMRVISRGIYFLMKKLGLFHRIKMLWRRRLSS